MAEFTAFRNNALPYPVYGLPYVVSFPLLDADGDPISPSSPDSEISKNGDTFADCTNEATEIATSSGICYLSLTGTELTTDCATVRVQSTGAKTTVLTLYPRKLVTIRTGTSASGGASTSTIILDASASAADDFYNGMIVAAVIDGVTEVRMITDYTGSTGTATVVPDWNVAPDNNDTFTIYRPDGVQIQQANATHWFGQAIPAPNSSGVPKVDVTGWVGSGPDSLISGRVPAIVGAVANDAITAAAIATGAIDADAIADNAIDAGAIANAAIDAATFAADARMIAAGKPGSVSDASPAAGNFDGDAGLSGTDDFYNGSVLAFTSGSLLGLARKITDYTGSTKNLVFATAFPAAPADTDTFVILGRIE